MNVRFQIPEFQISDPGMKPNVLFIIDSFEQGGSERQALQLLRDLHHSGRCNVRLACLQNKGSLRAEAEQLGIGEIHEYALTSFYNLNFLKQLRRLVCFVKQNEIDIVHTPIGMIHVDRLWSDI